MTEWRRNRVRRIKKPRTGVRSARTRGRDKLNGKNTHPWVLVLLESWLSLCVCRALVPPWLLIRPLVAALVVGGAWRRVPTSIRGVARVGVPCLSVPSLHPMIALVLTPLVPLIPCKEERQSSNGLVRWRWWAA